MAAPPSLLEALVSVVAPLPVTKPDNYANEGYVARYPTSSPLLTYLLMKPTRPLIQQPIGDGAFGGSVIGQAILAAYATVPDDFDLYSSQSSFLRPVKASRTVVYRVEHTADGRSYCTRVVRATQSEGGPWLFVSILSFQKRKPRRTMAVEGGTDHNNGLTFADAMPDMEGFAPRDLPGQGWKQMSFQIGEEKLKRMGVEADDPFEWRLLPFTKSGFSGGPSQTRIRGYVRANNASTPLTLSDPVNLASMALLSDQSLFELSLFQNWDSIPREWRELAMTISLNSRISFHDPTARVEEWMVCESRISWGADGRLSAEQRFWNRETGELLMTSTQDVVVSRPKPRL
ncbi:hypothetical protein PG997_002247 [Apiospora hydei]|uniref:Thioesterase-like superfamily-domain-containing protein n=1 Tax=Apiospora hydei TaxID=1337664 RepID=A0ABR1X8T6_9PEZI